MPEILVLNLSGSEHYDPGKARSEKWPGPDPPNFRLGCSFFGWVDWADFGVIRSGIVQLDFLPYEIFRSRASLTRYGPPNSKMVIFGCFWIFRQLRSFQIWKSKIYNLKAYWLALIWYQIYRIGPGSAELWPGEWWKTRKLCTNIIWCSDKINSWCKMHFPGFLGCSIRWHQKNFGPGHNRVVQSRPGSWPVTRDKNYIIRKPFTQAIQR